MLLRYSLCTLILSLLISPKTNVYGFEYTNIEIKEKSAYLFSGNTNIQYVHDPYIYNQSWDTLPQILFWGQIIDLPQDSCIINVASTRQVLGKMNFKTWLSQSEVQKKTFKDSLIKLNNLPAECSIFVTSGKKEFYNYKKEIPSISKAVKLFTNEGVSPWYAQTILLIESPGNLQKSSVGAYGSFQLMKSVGKKFGLIINEHIDERADFDKSAVAAAKLIKLVCIPEIKKILDNKCIAYNESDLWFRLLVLHAYHAGAGNVAAVINKINPYEGGVSVITNMWQTEAAGFRNASQNYSQIALASLIRFDKMIELDAKSIYISDGDRMLNNYFSDKTSTKDSLNYLSENLYKYAEDFTNGLIPIDYFLTKIKAVELEILMICNEVGLSEDHAYEKASCYLFSETKIEELGKVIIKSNKNNNTISLLKQHAFNHPHSYHANYLLAIATNKLKK